MKMPKLMAAAMLAFALAGCSKGVVGKYACDGIPGVKELELAADGSYGSKGTVMSDEMSASGTYKVDVLRIEEFHPDGSTSFVTDERSPIADKFSRFLRVFLLDHPGMQAALEIAFHLENGEVE